MAVDAARAWVRRESVRSAPEELVPALRAGDEDAFSKVAQDQMAGLYAVASGILGSAEEAEDACQEVLVRLYKAAPRLAPDTNLRAWLRRVCVNHCLDQMRRRKRHGRVAVVSMEHLQAPADARPDRATEDAEFRCAVLAALRRLSRQQRLVFVLRHFGGCSVRETAEILGCADGTIKSQLSRAVERLRTLLTDWAPDAKEVAEHE
jgi:RNA polymerase sigma-70 factor (ECF subfamily)